MATCSSHGNKENSKATVMRSHPSNFKFLSFSLNLLGHLILKVEQIMYGGVL